MGTREAAKALIGVLATLGMLVLASPGVKAERAAGAQQVSGPADQCTAAAAAAAPTGVDPELEAFLARLRREQRARAVDGGNGHVPVVVLNGRGYNYGAPPELQLEAVMGEALRARQRAGQR